jgi:glutathione peroxidase-family protein
MPCCTPNTGPMPLIVSVAAAFFLVGAAMVTTDAGEPDKDPPPTYVLGYEMPLINGEDQPLEDYKGQVVLMVNTASKCGLTPQYEGLQALYDDKGEDGLVILSFPANNFGKQEPGSNDEIAEFCTENFGVTFPMFEKISVKGDDAHPLYVQLAEQPEPIGGEPGVELHQVPDRPARRRGGSLRPAHQARRRGHARQDRRAAGRRGRRG